MFSPLQLIWRWGETFGLCTYCAPYQNPPLDLAFIDNSCLYSDGYRMMMFHFQHSFHIYHLVFYCNQTSSLLSYIFIFLLSVWTHGLFPPTAAPALIYNSSNYFGAQIVLDLANRSPLQAGLCVCYMPFFFFLKHFISDFFRIYLGLKVMTLGLICSGYWSRLRERVA